MDQLFAYLSVATLAVTGLLASLHSFIDSLSFWEGVILAFIFLCLFLMWWQYEAHERQADASSFEHPNPTA